MDYTIRISNSETGEVIDRPMTEEEIAEHLETTSKAVAEIEQKAQAKEEAQAKLAALGLTADDLKALGL